MHRFPTSAETDAWFAQLGAALAVYGLPTGGGRHRTDASADEFLLMHVDEAGAAHFKHRTSRNYITVRVAAGRPVLSIPLGAPFCGGTFPAPETAR